MQHTLVIPFSSENDNRANWLTLYNQYFVYLQTKKIISRYFYIFVTAKKENGNLFHLPNINYLE